MTRSHGRDLAPGSRDRDWGARWLDVPIILAAGLVVLGFVRLWAFSHGQVATIQVLMAGGTLANISGLCDAPRVWRRLSNQ